MRRSHDPQASLMFALASLLSSSLIFANTFTKPTRSAGPQVETCTPPSFRPTEHIIEPKDPSVSEPGAPALVTGDLDRDGRTDFIVASRVSSARFLNQGGGNFTVVPYFDSFFQDGVIADFDNDGYVDVAEVTADSVTVKLGYNPSWPAVPEVSSTLVGRYATALRAGDFNGDGKLDLAVVNSLSNNVALLLGKGNGNFEPPVTFPVQENPHALVVRDFNGDSKLDLATANEYSETVSLLLGDGNGSFSVTPIPAGALPQDLVAWDFNRDGKVDLALTNRGYNTVTVLQNDGAGNFSLAARWELTAIGTSITAGDFNRDGKEDLVVAHPFDGTLSVFLGNGSGGACSAAPLIVGAAGCCPITDLVTGDLNADGSPDLILARDKMVSVLLNTTAGGTNNPPTITPATIATLTAGSGAVTATLATVSDTETAAGSLKVELTSTPAGVTLSNLTNNNGTISAQVTVACATAAGTQAVGLKVTDAQGLSATANVQLSLAANPPPALGTYPAVTLGAGNTTVNPSRSPSDNGTITSLTAVAQNYGGAVAIDAQGVVTITNNGVAGTYQVTVTATDNCGVTATTSFAFTIDSAPPPTTCDTISLNAPQHIAAGSAPHGMATGDVNGDGLPDLVVANRYDTKVTLLLGTNEGGVRSFRNAASLEVGFDPRAVAIQDLNGDGKADLAVVNRSSDTVTILLGDGAGAFTAAGNYDAGNKPFSVAVGDFNSDGKPDLVVVNEGIGNLAILDGNGNGSFAAPRYFPAGAAPQPALVGDFNKDGKADVVVANFTTNQVTVLLGDGQGGFASVRSFDTGPGWNPAPLALGDMNNDGIADLLVGKTGFRQVAVMIGFANGAFGYYTAFLAGREPASVALADFDGDGKLDAAVSGYQDNSLAVFQGNGRGTYDSLKGLYVPVGAQPLALLQGDFNGDGKPDLALANSGSGTVSVVLNGCGK